MPPPVPATGGCFSPSIPPSRSSPSVHDLIHHQERPLHVVQQPALLHLLPAGGTCHWSRSQPGVPCKVPGPGPLPSQSSTGPIPPGALGDRGFTPAPSVTWGGLLPCTLPQFPHPRRWGLGTHRRRWLRVSRRQASTADSISCGRMGVSAGAVGIPWGCPPPPHTYLVLLAAPHHIEEEVDAAPVDDGESFQTGDLTCAAWGHGTVLVSPGTVQEGMLPQAWCPSGIKPFATVSPPKGGTHPPPSPPARWVLLKTLLSKAACSLAVGKVPS